MKPLIEIINTDNEINIIKNMMSVFLGSVNIDSFNKKEIINILTEIEKSPFGVYRKFMSINEIKICNKLVKKNFLYKSKPDEKNATIAFFISEKGIKWLESQLKINK